MMISDILGDAKTVAIFGHVRPDGDCIGSTLGLAVYLRDNYPELKINVYLESFSDHFKIIPGMELVHKGYYQGEEADLCVLLDVSSAERIGANGADCIIKAKNSICIDHHVSNPRNICNINIVKDDMSSASEVIMDMLEIDRISSDCAQCLYMGIAHDTGVFQFSCTSPDTLRKVALLMEKNIPFSNILQNTYFTRTFNQVRATGKVLESAQKALDGKVIYGYLTYDDMKKYMVNSLEMDGIVDALREYEDCDVAIFMYPLRDHYKLSLRSKEQIDVNRVCNAFGGGGHVRASGCQMQGNPEELIARVVEEIAKQV